MRMSSFLLGGIIGAAAVVYLNKRGMTSFARMASANGTAGQFMNKAKQAVSNFQMGSMSSNHSSSSHSSASGKQSVSGQKADSGSGFKQVEHIIAEDPQLKATVQDILEHNHKSDFSPIHK